MSTVAPTPAAVPPPVFGARLAAGLTGIFIAAMMAGLNNRVASLGLADVRGALGLGLDQASWLSTAYAAGELVVMPFAAWFAVTLSLRRFHLIMVACVIVLAAVIPFAHSLPLLLVLRALQGVFSGALIPVLMMAALRFLPAPIRLHGLALYAMTATFAPNLAIWLTGAWTDGWSDWRLIYWQVIPIGALAMALVAWGVPVMPAQPQRWREANWFGAAFGVAGLALLAVAIDQGGRLDWFNSPLVRWAVGSGLACVAVFLASEFVHPAPFIRPQLLGRRNLALGFTIFVSMLVVLLSGSFLPAGYLASVQDYRAVQSAPIGLIVGLPQLVLGSVVALLLYQKWVDARIMMATGLALIGLACFQGAQLTDAWIWRDFIWPQLLQCVGQPMAIVSLLFLSTSVVQPAEGPYVSGIINMLRALGTLLGSAGIAELITQRGRFHADMLLGEAAGNAAFGLLPAGQFGSIVQQQSFILATADAYRVLGVFALALVPLCLLMTRIPAPVIPAPVIPSATPAPALPPSTVPAKA